MNFIVYYYFLLLLLIVDQVIVCGLANAVSTHESINDLIDEWGVQAKKLCMVKRGYVNEGVVCSTGVLSSVNFNYYCYLVL